MDNVQTLPQVTLEWAIKKFGAGFFRVKQNWTRSDTVYKYEDRSTLSKVEPNMFGGVSSWGMVTAMKNAAKIIRGEDKEKVKIKAFRLISKIIPERRRMSLPVRARTFATTVGDSNVPTFAEHQEIEIPSFCIDAINFDRRICEMEMDGQLRKLGLSEPISIECDSSFYFLPS